jgi:hypothetical protein
MTGVLPIRVCHATGEKMLVSLGHSCQTRFVLEDLDGASRRMPFDFNITTRAALLKALETDGASLQHDEDTARVFRMASDGREGIEASGMYFWHDYPLAEDKLSLAEGWRSEIGRVNEKYAALWSRLAALLRSDEEKTLVLSNSQHNLGQFAEDDDHFARRFGLGRQAFHDIADALDRYGAKNYRLLFMTRSVADLAETLALQDPRLEHRFVGILSLRPDRRIAASIAPGRRTEDILPLCGPYENGEWHVTAVSRDIAMIHRRTDEGLAPHGSITRSDIGLVAWTEGRDRFQDVDYAAGKLHFPDGSIWRQD